LRGTAKKPSEGGGDCEGDEGREEGVQKKNGSGGQGSDREKEIIKKKAYAQKKHPEGREGGTKEKLGETGVQAGQPSPKNRPLEGEDGRECKGKKRGEKEKKRVNR